MGILTAEDDPVSREILRHWLANLGHEVREADNGQTAWELFQGAPAEVVITDWMMPAMDGLSLCQKVRSLKVSHYVYVVFLTVMNGKTQYLQAIAAVADDFLSKPLEREQLATRLHVATRLLGLHREIGQLRGALRVCPGCKSYCDDHEHWQPIERLIEPNIGGASSPVSAPSAKGSWRAPERTSA